jgi:hypothetical protein
MVNKQADGYETGYLEAERLLNENKLRLEAMRARRRDLPQQEKEWRKLKCYGGII